VQCIDENRDPGIQIAQYCNPVDGDAMRWLANALAMAMAPPRVRASPQVCHVAGQHDVGQHAARRATKAERRLSPVHL